MFGFVLNYNQACKCDYKHNRPIRQLHRTPHRDPHPFAVPDEKPLPGLVEQQHIGKRHTKHAKQYRKFKDQHILTTSIRHLTSLCHLASAHNPMSMLGLGATVAQVSEALSVVSLAATSSK